MKFGKRSDDDDAGPGGGYVGAPPAEQATQAWGAAAAPPGAVEPAVDGVAVELPGYEQAVPDPMPFPVGGEPVAVVTPGPEASPVTSLGDSGEAFASGHASEPAPSWQEPVIQIANDRPELLVAAAFGGGLLTAMILRRLGR